jgi:hypothetical protein
MTCPSVIKIAQTVITSASTVMGMDSELSNSLEAIANLLYLIRKSLHNPAAVSTYVGLAQDRMREIAFRCELGSLPETMLG